MPQLDQFTYFTQFFWFCLFFFAFYIAIFNDRDGFLGIARILKLRNQLLSQRGNHSRSNDLHTFEEVLKKGFHTGISYMDSTLQEVSLWSKSVDFLGKKGALSLISCFGEISGSRRMERTILKMLDNAPIMQRVLNLKPSYISSAKNEIMLIHVLRGQRNIVKVIKL